MCSYEAQQLMSTLSLSLSRMFSHILHVLHVCCRLFVPLFLRWPLPSPIDGYFEYASMGVLR